ncbi:MAG: hypothetical protein F6K36_20290 [Symploca sp. SIO3C6]|uniref:Uncharacterized protein n=1 Tax=Symploca sp. SIO1C4 TaxID=2607765 RepID=A0A6B3N769_9CYAN|nr:hypothetical protein [Symploca sp. SIO3C6]NER26665.1 hypothetical protein [Symploca sp. SIO1C4]
MTTWTDSEIRPTLLEERQLYNHLLYFVQLESPTQMIDRFRNLFMGSGRYQDPQIWYALEKLAMNKYADRYFKFILNRCCHILINRWHLNPQLQWAVSKLIGLFENLPNSSRAGSQSHKRIWELLHSFRLTEQYLTLRRLSQVMTQTPLALSSGAKQVANLIQRYPYLYEHCLLSEDSSYEHQQTVRQIRSRIQLRFELDLSRYVTHQVRYAQVMRRGSDGASETILQSLKNPTLLSDRDLGAVLKHFVGKVQDRKTYWDFAQSFLVHSNYTPSYKQFKEDLYEYLTASMDPAYGKRHFNEQLYQYLKNTYPHNDFQKPNEFLIIRTCSRLLNFLVVDNPVRPNHFTFVDLTTNLGETVTTGLLLKIVLVSHKIKPSLEKRFAILFNHYESSHREGVPWLVKSLENMNIALSLHFGSADVSCLNQIM